MVTESVPNALLDAYNNTVFVLFQTEYFEEIEVRINQKSSRIDDFLRYHNSSAGVFLTAFNPRSLRLSAQENGERHQMLIADLDLLSHSYFDGEGRDPNGNWLSEKTLFILGLAEVQAEKMARKYTQNAYVFIEHGEPAELVLTGLET